MQTIPNVAVYSQTELCLWTTKEERFLKASIILSQPEAIEVFVNVLHLLNTIDRGP